MTQEEPLDLFELDKATVTNIIVVDGVLFIRLRRASAIESQDTLSFIGEELSLSVLAEKDSFREDFLLFAYIFWVEDLKHLSWVLHWKYN